MICLQDGLHLALAPRETPRADGLRVVQNPRDTNGIRRGGVDDPAGGEHAPEELWEVLETSECRADADASFVVGGRSPRGPLALLVAPARILVEAYASPRFMRF